MNSSKKKKFKLITNIGLFQILVYLVLFYYSGHHELYEILQIYTICVAKNARF